MFSLTSVEGRSSQTGTCTQSAADQCGLHSWIQFAKPIAGTLHALLYLGFDFGVTFRQRLADTIQVTTLRYFHQYVRTDSVQRVVAVQSLSSHATYFTGIQSLLSQNNQLESLLVRDVS